MEGCGSNERKETHRLEQHRMPPAALRDLVLLLLAIIIMLLLLLMIIIRMVVLVVGVVVLELQRREDAVVEVCPRARRIEVPPRSRPGRGRLERRGRGRRGDEWGGCYNVKRGC
jgi:hypothetical protein